MDCWGSQLQLCVSGIPLLSCRNAKSLDVCSGFYQTLRYEMTSEYMWIVSVELQKSVRHLSTSFRIQRKRLVTIHQLLQFHFEKTPQNSAPFCLHGWSHPGNVESPVTTFDWNRPKPSQSKELHRTQGCQCAIQIYIVHLNTTHSTLNFEK